jgi:hypothetical protein
MDTGLNFPIERVLEKRHARVAFQSFTLFKFQNIISKAQLHGCPLTDKDLLY